MPIYEYECADCGDRFEAFHHGGDRKKPPCKSCRSTRVKRVISPAGFVLKGSGWYKTDYPSEARKKALESEKKDQPAAKTGEKTEANGEKAASVEKPAAAGVGKASSSAEKIGADK